MKKLIQSILAGITILGGSALYSQDLKPTSVIGPEETLVPGDAAEFVVTIENTTTTDITDGPFVVELDVDSLGTQQVNVGESIPGESTIEVPVSYDITQSIANGTYEVTSAEVDVNDDIAETDETNNTLNSPGASVTVEAFADLTISSVELSKAPYYPGDPISFIISYSNEGERDAEPFAVDVDVSSPDFGNDFSGTASVGGLEAGGTSELTITETIPLDNINGTYEVIATIDSNDVVVESVEDNNSFETEFGIDTNPDLQITHLTFDTGNWEAGDPLDFTLELTNNSIVGNVKTVSVLAGVDLYDIKVVLSTDTEFGNDDDFMLYNGRFSGDPVNGDNLIPGESVNISWIQTMPKNFSGDYFVLAKVDVREEVDELVENDIEDNGNNTWISNETAKITLLPSDNPQSVTERGSVLPDGTEGDKLSEQPSLSEDGRYMVFASLSRLSEEDEDDYFDIYLRDNYTGEVSLVSKSLASGGTDGDSRYPQISADGEYVVWQSESSSLVSGDSNEHSDIFLAELDTGNISRVSVDSSGELANSGSFSPSISGDGQWVTFASRATNLVTGGTTEGRSHVYTHEVATGSTTLVSLSDGGGEANDRSLDPVISADGNFVVFVSEATDVVAGFNGQQVYRVNNDGSNPVLVSQDGGVQGNGRSFMPSVSEDGNVVAFATDATNLDGSVADINGLRDVIIRDISGDTTDRIHTASGDLLNQATSDPAPEVGALEPSISADGRFVVYRTQSDNILPNSVTRTDGTVFNQVGFGMNGYNPATDTALVGYSDLNNTSDFESYATSDVYLYDRNNPGSPELISVNRFGYQGYVTLNEEGDVLNVPSSRNPAISGNGRYVAFASDGNGVAGFDHGPTNQISNDGNGARDVFVHDRRTLGSFNFSNPPSVSIDSPADGSTVTTGVSQLIEATATDNIHVDNVDIYVNGDLIESLDRPDYFTQWTPSEVGIYRIKAVATDNDGIQAESEIVTVTAAASTGPAVEITTPEDNEIFWTTESFAISATADDADGNVSQVEFFADGESLGAVNSAPYTISNNVFAPGVYELTAVATDNAGNRTISIPISVSIQNPSGPSVALTSPDITDADSNGVADTSLQLNDTYSVNATATSSEVSLASVEFFVNGDSIGLGSQEDSLGNYSIDWTPELSGLFTIEVVATDALGNEANHSMQYSVVTGSAPSVSLTATDGDSDGVADDDLTVFESYSLEAAVSDSDGNIDSVEFFVDGDSVGDGSLDGVTGNYSISWTPDSLGLFEIDVVATDDDGNQSVDTLEFSVVTGIAPTVALTAVDGDNDGTADDSVALFDTTTLEANASDADGEIEGVEFLVDGESLGIAELTGSGTYAVDWTPDSLGNHEVEVIAEDNTGNLATDSLFFSVVSGNAPTVNLVSPDPTDSDSNGVADDSLIVSETHRLSANADDTDGTITKVEFFAEGTLLGEGSLDGALGTYSIDWTPEFTGTYTIEVVATDDLGNQASDILDYSVVTGSVPDVSFVNPDPADGDNDNVADASLTRGLEYRLSVSATDPDGEIDSVSVSINNGPNQEMLETEVLDRYDFAWTPELTGTHEVRVFAVDDSGNETVSVLEYNVVDGNPPVVDFLSPDPADLDNDQVADKNINWNESVSLTFGITDNDDLISSVDVFLNGELLGQANESGNVNEYVIEWTPELLGEHQVKVVAEDELGNQGLANLAYNVATGSVPTVDIVNPDPTDGDGDGVADETLVVSNPLEFTAEVSDADGSISQVEVYINDQFIGSAEETTSFGEYSIEYTPELIGTMELRFEAEDDLGNVTVESADFQVVSGDVPTVAILNPDPSDGNGDMIADDTLLLQEQTTFSFEASDSDGTIESVEVFRGGVNLGTADLVGGNYEFEYTPTEIGVAEWEVVATDDLGNTARASANFQVISGETPDLSFVSPDPQDSDNDGIADNGLQVNQDYELVVNADDPDGQIERVQFFANGQDLGNGTESGSVGNYSVGFIPQLTGHYLIEVIAEDDLGNTTEISLTYPVATGSSPTISILSPPDDGHYLPGTSLPVQALAADDDGLVDSVNFYLNGVLFSEENTAPFRTSVSLPSTGTYSLRALAIDNHGNETWSDPISITAGGLDEETPRVSIDHPLPLGGGDIINDVSVDSSMYLNAEAIDPDGSIEEVRFYINGQLLGTADNQFGDDYSIFFDPNAQGSYVIMAEAVDNDGIVGQAVPILLEVGPLQSPLPEASLREPFEMSPINQPVELFVDADAGLLEIDRVDFYAQGVLIGSTEERAEDGSFRFTWTPDVAGEYDITARTVQVDPGGNEFDNWLITDSVPLEITGEATGTPPSVVITYPETGFETTSSSNLLIQAGANDTDGNVDQIDFYVDNELVGSDSSEPYNVEWTPGSSGTYQLLAVATDNDGNYALSDTVIMDVEPAAGNAPEISILTPDPTDMDDDGVADQSLRLNTLYPISIEALGSAGVVETVEIWNNGEPVDFAEQNLQTGKWSLDWQARNVGLQDILVIARDSMGNESNRLVTYEADEMRAPFVSLSSPDEGSVHTVLNPISMEASAHDFNGSISMVEFYVNSRLEGTSENYPFTSSFIPNSPGTYNLVARAYNDRGLSSISEGVEVTVEESQSIGVDITSPADGKTVNLGSPFLVTATAQSTGGDDLVLDFYANGSLIDTDESYPYNILWTPRSEGEFALRVVAREAATDAVVSSDEVIVNVEATEVPEVTFLSPNSQNPTVGSDVLVEVDASDPDGSIESVEFFVNGEPLGDTDFEQPFSTFWRPGSKGQYILTALVIDDSGNQVIENKEVTVGDPVGIVPSVTLSVTASGNVTPGSRVVARANVFDDDPRDMSVTFFMNGTQVGSADTTPPYTVIMDPELNVGNSYEITAVAKDRDGNSRASVLSPLYISDVPLDQPSIDIVSPSNDDELTVGSRASVRVELVGGAVEDLDQIVFYADGVEIGRDSTFPYVFDWIPEKAGEVQLTAATLLERQQYDHDDDSETPFINVTPVNVASPINVNVSSATGVLPSISLDVLPGNESLAIGSKALLFADAQDLDGEVSKVDFFMDGVMIGSDDEAPFTHTLTTTREGDFILHATASDNDGNVVTSSFENLEVLSRVVTQTPSINLAVPESGQEGSLLSLRASAQDFVNGPESVVFYANGQQVDSTSEVPYMINWLANLSGDVNFFATAQQTLSDETVVSTVSEVLLRELDENEAPVIESFEYTFSNEDATTKPNPLIGETITFSIEVSDTGPVNQVELLRDGETIEASDDSSSPYEISDTPPGLGLYEYSVVVTDRGGLQTESSAETVSVVKGMGPEVEVTAPESGSTVTPNTTVRMRASASDADGTVTEVQFYVDGQPVSDPITETPYVFDYSPATADDYKITARARDNSGNLTASEEVILTVIPDNPPSFVTFDNDLPADTARLNSPIRWSLDTEDDFGVVSVKLYRNNNEVPSAGEVPFEIEDTPPNTGRFTYYAEAIDTGGNVTRSGSIVVDVVLGSAPVVSIDEPQNNADASVGDPIVVRASASPGEESEGLSRGSIEQVELFQNNRSFAVLESAPYIAEFTPSAEGTFFITAVATTDTGKTAKSEELRINGIDGNVPQLLNFTNDTGDNTSLTNVPITFVVEASDERGIDRVELVQNGNLASTVFTSPYEMTVIPENAGLYQYFARVTNRDGNTVTSETVDISVREPNPVEEDNDFVFQTFQDLLLRTPTSEELSNYSGRIEGDGLSRDQFVRELMSLDEYQVIRHVILANKFLLGEYPTREKLSTDMDQVKDSSLEAVVTSMMPAFEERYVEAINDDPDLKPKEEITRLPDSFGSEREIELYLSYLFRLKYGVLPTNNQLETASRIFPSLGLDGFTTTFIEDTETVSGPTGHTSLKIGYRFSRDNPPDERYLDLADAASLLINLLRVDPEEEELESMADKLFVTQVSEIVNDPRYKARFKTAFNTLMHYANNWKYSDWFGWFNTSYEPWVYHLNHGWISFRVMGQSEKTFWYFDRNMGWIWTKPATYPNVFESKTGHWLLTPKLPYVEGEERWFYDLNTRNWIGK